MDRNQVAFYAKVGVAALVGSVVGVLVVLPLVPLVLELVVGIVATVLDVILPGGQPEPA